MKVRFNKKAVIKWSLIVVIIFFLIIGLGILVPGYVAFKTNRYVPLYSEVVEKAEQFLWERYEDKAIKLAIDEFEQDIDSLSEDDEGKIDITEVLDNYESVEQVMGMQDNDLPSEVTMDFVVAGQVYLPNYDTGKDEKYNYDFKIYGSSEIDNKSNDFEGTYSVDGSAYMFSMKEKFNIKSDSENGVAFIKISDGTLLRDLGGWFYLDWNELVEESEITVEEDDQDNEDTEIKFKKEQIDEIKNFIKSDLWLPETTIEKGKTFDGKRARCINRSWDREKFKQMIAYLDKQMPKMNEDYEDEITQIILFLEGLNEVKIYSCVDRQDGNIYELDTHIEYNLALNGTEIWDDFLDEDYSKISANEDMMSVLIDLNLKFEGYGEQKNIVFPNEAITAEEYWKDFYLEDLLQK